MEVNPQVISSPAVPIVQYSISFDNVTAVLTLALLPYTYSHLLRAWRRRQQWNHNNHHSSEAAQQNGKVEVVDSAQHGRSQVLHGTSGRREGELQHHSANSYHQPHHQAPESSLQKHTHSICQRPVVLLAVGISVSILIDTSVDILELILF